MGRNEEQTGLCSGPRLDSNSGYFSDYGYFFLDVLCALAFLAVMTVVLIIVARIRIKTTMPVVPSCSAAIAAASHRRGIRSENIDFEGPMGAKEQDGEAGG